MSNETQEVKTIKVVLWSRTGSDGVELQVPVDKIRSSSVVSHKGKVYHYSRMESGFGSLFYHEIDEPVEI